MPPIIRRTLFVLASLRLLLGCKDDELRERVDRAVDKVYPALVRIHVVAVGHQEGREVKVEAVGSGVIISAEGHVITNHHVAGKAKRIRCTLADREELEATLVGSDPLADIAVVKLDLSGRKDPLPAATFGDSDKLRVGDRVLAMGSPAAVSQSVTMGIVSNLELTFPSLLWPFTLKLDGEEVGSLVKWIGHDAAIYGGNSGGPLVDLDGQVVGINEISIGLGGAIPSNLAREIARQIIEHEGVQRGWIGVRCQPLLKKSGRREGVLVADVLEGSPGAVAGLCAGDIILRYDGRPVSARFAEQIPVFNRLVFSTPVGKEVELRVLREGNVLTLKVKTAQWEPARGKERELKAWGITAREITTLQAKELKRSDKTGALVTSVRPGGPAGEAKPAVRRGDVIVEVAGKHVEDLERLEGITRDIVRGREKKVPTLVSFERKAQRFLTVVKLGLSEKEQKPREVSKAWLPAAFQVLTRELAESLNLKGTTGVVITQVYPISTAEEAGLKVGDIITHLDGEHIQASQPEDIELFPQMIREYKIGSTAGMTVLRTPGYEKTKLSVRLPERPVPGRRAKRYEDRNFDFEARDVTYMDRVRERWEESQGGALVTAVEPGGWAALAHLAVGDLILSVDGVPVEGASALEARMKAVAEERPRQVDFLVLRDIHTLYVEMEPAWPDRAEE